MPPPFTPAAQLLWNAIPPHFQERILHNIWCPHCGDMTTMTDFSGEVHGKSLVLRETCVTCCGKVARVLEGAPVGEALQPGDKIIWWKRIPGGDYVYPFQATVLARTEKRVKIAAYDDGEIVTWSVPHRRWQIVKMRNCVNPPLMGAQRCDRQNPNPGLPVLPNGQRG